MAGPDEAFAGIRNTLKWLVRATVVLFAATAFVAVAGKLQADRSTDALCALRVDLQKRVETSERFLRENPEGVPGISPTVIREGIVNQQRTIAALSKLDC